MLIVGSSVPTYVHTDLPTDRQTWYTYIATHTHTLTHLIRTAIANFDVVCIGRAKNTHYTN